MYELMEQYREQYTTDNQGRGKRHVEMRESEDDADGDDNSMRGEDVEEKKQPTPPTIGKLRLMKSGKVVMRIQLPGQDDYVDLEMNRGIQPNFYQELVSVDIETQKMHFLSKVQHKLVAIPDLDQLFSNN